MGIIMKAFLKNHWHWLVLTAFLFIHGLTSAFTTLYGDDYYYAAFVNNGKRYFLNENIFHYLHTNGRAAVHILDELLLGWNFWAWRIFNIICLGALVIGIAKLASRDYREESDRRTYRLALAATCAIFCITDVAILRQSFYWATGMMNYLFPATLTIWFYYLFRRDFEKFKGSWLLLIAALIASATTEQASAASLLVTLCFIVSSFVVKKKMPRPTYFGAFIASAVGFCTLYLSPGNSERTGYYPDFYALSIFGRIGKNFNDLTNIIFKSGGLCAVILIEYALIALVCFKYYKERKLPVISLLVGFESLLTAGIYAWALTANQALFEFWWMKVLLLIPIVSSMIFTAVKYFTAHEIDELYFVWCAVAMQCAMSLSPEFGPRTLTMSLVTLTVPLVRRILENDSAGLRLLLAGIAFILLPSYTKFPGMLVLVLIGVFFAAVLLCRDAGAHSLENIAGCFVLALALAQFSTVAAGYHGNVAVHELNRANIEAYLAEDEPPESIVLYYLPFEQYRYTMPYDNPYHAGKLLELCGIDPKITVWYEFLPQYTYN